MLPTYTQLSETYGKLNFYKVDVDEHAQLTQEAGARVYPTFIVYRGGTQVRLIPEPGNLIVFSNLFRFHRYRPFLVQIPKVSR